MHVNGRLDAIGHTELENSLKKVVLTTTTISVDVSSIFCVFFLLFFFFFFSFYFFLYYSSCPLNTYTHTLILTQYIIEQNERFENVEQIAIFNFYGKLIYRRMKQKLADRLTGKTNDSNNDKHQKQQQ